MRNAPIVNVALALTLLLAVAVSVSEGRGGRRGGGTLGGIFGGWRKYKKPSFGGISRRGSNASPPNTAIVKPLVGGESAAASMKAAMYAKSHASYPRQPPLAGIGGAHLPPGGSYYANTAAMPAGAIYHAQPPMRSSSGDLLFGMMAGHMLFGSHFRPHITHVYHQSAPQNATSAGSKVIIVENGQPPAAGFADGSPSSQSEPERAQQPQAGADLTSGIICVPLLFNQTDPADATRFVPVERVVCYPAPPLPLTPLEATSCVTHTVLEADPDDPTKTVEVLREDCQVITTEAPQVAGEIDDDSETE